MEKGQGFSPEYSRFFVADKGSSSSPENNQEKLNKKQGKLSDLNTVLSKVPEEARNDVKKYDEYKATVNEAKNRLKESGIDTDLYTKKDLQIGTKEGNKAYGQRKAELRVIVEKLVKGEDLNEEEIKKAEIVNIKKDDLFIEEITKEENVIVEPEKVIAGPWEAELAIIDRVADPKLQKEMRSNWVMTNLGKENIPYSVKEAQLNKINQEYQAPVKENKTEENKPAIEKKERNFTPEEEKKIIEFCMDTVLENPGIKDMQAINKALLGGEGFIAVNLKNGEEVPLDAELLKKIESLGLYNWMRVRDTVGRWEYLKELNGDEFKPSSLNDQMFLDKGTEKSMANSKCKLPFTDKNTGRVTLKEVDLGLEISKAMKTMREWFEGSIDENGNPVAPENRKLREYWYLIGAESDTKKDFFAERGINRYIGEAALAELLSYQMLTDTSMEDFMLMMVQEAISRPTKYKVNEANDPFGRMLAQGDLVAGEKPFTVFSDSEFKTRRKEMELRLAKMLPSQLIPTGLTLGEWDPTTGMSEGEKHLREGDWMKWRANVNLFTRAQYEGASPENKRPATDQDTRLAMMRSALVVLQLIKEVQNPGSDIDKFNEMTGRVYAHANASYRDTGWLIKKGNDFYMPASVSPLNERGEKADMEVKEWVSRLMLTCAEMFVYTHSIADHKNPKPLDMWTLSQFAERVLMSEVQSEKGAFIGMSEQSRDAHRREYVEHVDRIWKNSWEVIDAVNSKKTPDKFPKWFISGVSPRQSLVEACKSSAGSLSQWNRLKSRMKLRYS